MRDIDDGDDEESRSAKDDASGENQYSAPRSNSFRKQPDDFRFSEFASGFVMTAFFDTVIGLALSGLAPSGLIAIGIIQIVVVWPLLALNKGPERRSLRLGITTCAVIVLLLNAACYALLATMKFH